jgi:excisionase family DNA binding protein
MNKTVKPETPSHTRTWTPAQIAAMLHVSVATVRKAIEAGQLTATKVNGDDHISEESMKEFLKAGNPFAQ